MGLNKESKRVRMLRMPVSWRFSAGKAVAAAISPMDMNPTKSGTMRENFIVTVLSFEKLIR